MKKLVAAAVAVGTSHLFAAMGPSDYIQDGLVALYDAEFNATNAQGVAIHDAAATTWVNLVTGTGNLTLPTSGVTINAKEITLDMVTAAATDCSAATQTGPVTLETCARSATTSTDTKNNSLMLVTVVNRAGIGLDARKDQSAVIQSTDVSDFTKSKNKYFWFVKSTFASYAPVHRTYSGVIPVNGGNLYANGLAADAASSPWTAASASAPTGELTVGNTKISVAYNCIRIYNRELTEDERQYNNAVDAVRFRGADASTATPYGYSFDGEGNVILPEAVVDAGVKAFGPGSCAKFLLNKCASGIVTLDGTGASATPDQAIGFTGFEAVGNSTTVFRGGWWDFGLGAFLPEDLSGRTVTLEGGAVVTNVGAVTLAGATGMNNKLRITDESAMSADSVTLGAKDGEQHNDLEIVGGSSLTLSGNLKMSAYPKQIGNSGNNRTRNVVTVAGEGTTLDVTGSTFLSWVSSGYNASTGGNTLYVTNGATASLGNLRLTQGLFFGGDDTAVFEDAHVTTRNMYIASEWSSAGRGPSRTLVHIGAGSVVTNTEAIYIGSYSNDRNGQDTIELVISNATFHTAKIREGAKGYFYLLGGPRATLRISGEDAKFTIGGGVSTYFFKPNNTIIVENGATYSMRTSGFNSTSDTQDETIIVRSRATLNWPSGFTTIGTNKNSLRDKVIVEGDSKMIVTGGSSIYGTDCELVIDDSEFRTSNGLFVGTTDRDSRALLAIRGTHPKLNAGWNLAVASNSCVRIELPATGYDAGFATRETPVVYCAHSSGEMTFSVDATSRVELTGAKELQDYCTETGKRGEYVLVRANHIRLTDEQLEAMRAPLTEGMTLFVRAAAGKDELVLKVRPLRGICIIVR